MCSPSPYGDVSARTKLEQYEEKFQFLQAFSNICWQRINRLGESRQSFAGREIIVPQMI
jgi:hypothetical protein